MTTKALLLLATLTLCCITAVHGLPSNGYGCRCIKTTYNRILISNIRRIEVIPVSGSCRWTEIIVTRKKGGNICVNPNAKWIYNMISNLQKNSVISSSATVAPSQTSMETVL
ncbi:C-X-C motif chemokine 10 isoform X2 [Thalassophryne amazonica]|uniref:C-X-C motif chemokine 10 isoform X2 n=1 Tax=Thalassophryne amazonica TaxID=390379 RepID=UPI001471ED92|nr:C-X-C motif chemokine 10 isoform X2 [Thalassophryne amazonica]